MRAHVWKPGQSGNPSGHSGLYGETVKLAREAAPAAMRRLIELMTDEDKRVATVACTAVLERAFGKPREYDPAKDGDTACEVFDPSRLTPRQLNQLEAALCLYLKAMVEPDAIREIIEAERGDGKQEG